MGEPLVGSSREVLLRSKDPSGDSPILPPSPRRLLGNDYSPATEETTMNTAMERQIPTLPAEPRDDDPTMYQVWCEHCRRWHLHGRGLGHRGAHCVRDDSPYLATGYILALPPQKEDAR